MTKIRLFFLMIATAIFGEVIYLIKRGKGKDNTRRPCQGLSGASQGL